MRVAPECLPCYFTQCLNTLVRLNLEDREKIELLSRVAEVIPHLPPHGTPAANSTVVIQRLISLLGVEDPFREAKKESNRLALAYLPRLRRLLKRKKDRVYWALKLAVAGNVVDLGLFRGYDLDRALRQVLREPFAVCDYEIFQSALTPGKRVLLIGDNAGEIVFDIPLVEELKRLGLEVVYAVKGGPILNDATLEDAEEVGMNRVARVITTGLNYLGVPVDLIDGKFRQEMEGADLVISKGQANFETLEGEKIAGRKTFFLLKAKCLVVAKALGTEYGKIVFVQNKVKEED